MGIEIYAHRAYEITVAIVGFFVWIAPVISAVGLVIGAVAGWATYIFYHRRSLNENWGTVFRTLYAEYWNDNDMGKMRKLLASESEYSELELILRKRLDNEKNIMSPEENDVLERLDRFCALMVRVLSFGDRDMNKQQRDLYEPLFTYWTDLMSRRAAVMDYIAIYWKSLHKRLSKSKKQ